MFHNLANSGVDWERKKNKKNKSQFFLEATLRGKFPQATQSQKTFMNGKTATTLSLLWGPTNKTQKVKLHGVSKGRMYHATLGSEKAHGFLSCEIPTRMICPLVVIPSSALQKTLIIPNFI